MKRCYFLSLIIGLILILNHAPAAAQIHWDMAKAGDVHKILSERERADVFNENLAYRLDHILPMVMRREGIDCPGRDCRRRQRAFAGRQKLPAEQALDLQPLAGHFVQIGGGFGHSGRILKQRGDRGKAKHARACGLP